MSHGADPGPGRVLPLDERRGEPLLAVRGLEKHYPVTSGLLGRTVGHVRAVDGVDLDCHAGETVAVVGESGCGKTSLAETILGLREATGGAVYYRGEEVTGLPDRRLRRELAMTFQDPFSSLNERLSVERIVAEPLVVHGEADGERRARVRTLLERVGLDPDGVLEAYPHELSGGQRQRVGIARALALDPALLVADEPTSALDVSVQAQILDLLEALQAELGLAVLLVTHDVSVVRQVADRVVVMYLGRVVETGTVDEVLGDPAHPYTEALLSSVPRVRTGPPPDRGPALTGEPPDPADPPSGCHYHPRCHLREALDDERAARCVESDPPAEPAGPGRRVACHWRPDEEEEEG